MAYPAELETFYYHAHFTEMLGFSSTVYHHCLRDAEREFLCRFDALPMPAQCLYIRMVNRKTDVFSPRNLQYAEIESINDMMALGCLLALSEAGVKAPDDVAVVGFDDIPISRFTAPPLTTLRVGIFDLGRRGLEMLAQALTAPPEPAADRPPAGVVVAPELVVRESSRHQP